MQGDTINRLAPPNSKKGSFAAPPGTSFPEMGLPPDRLNPSWNTTEYVVVQKLPPEVLEGVTESAFGQSGGGVQYFFPKGIQWYVDNHYLDVLP
ncbi:TNT domain-containing protein [Conyzicola nivalis]